MADGKLLHICVSATKGIAKHEVPGARITVEHGLEGDAHAGEWHRQVSLLAHVDIETMRAKGLALEPGAFGENLVVDGLQTDQLGVGSRLRIGPVLLELTQIGKVCHTRCAIYYSTGDCIMPRTGLFARVLEGGELIPGASVEVVHRIARSVIQAAVITISESSAAGAAFYTAAPALSELLRAGLQARIAWTQTIACEIELISAALKELCDRRVDLVITIGSAGKSARDVAPEATRNVVDRGLAEIIAAMRTVSAEEDAIALLTPAVGGARRETLIVNLSGSLNSAMESLNAMLPALPDTVKMLRGETAPAQREKERLITL